MTIQELYDNSKKINLDQMRDKVLMSIEQLGIDGDNKTFPSYANLLYAEYKNSKNPKSEGRYDLKDTGNFYSGLFAELTDTTIVIQSHDEKNEIINEMMEGYAFEKLTPENFDMVQRDYALPEFMNTFKEAMQID
jgi:hypothetical protein